MRTGLNGHSSQQREDLEVGLDQVTTRALLIIDQGPIFDEALTACQRACLMIDVLKNELQRFETKDVPAYQRWYHSTFGKYLTEVREASALIMQREEFLYVIRKKHWDRFFSSETENAKTKHARASREGGA